MVFSQPTGLGILPFAFGRFLLANKEILKATDDSIEKELSIVIEWEALANIGSSVLFFYEITPRLMALLSESGIKISITKTLGFS